jgi:hypothetical protein
MINDNAAPILPKIHVDYEDERFWVRIPFALNYLIQGIGDKRWYTNKKLWAIDPSWRTKAALEKLALGDGVDMTIAALRALEGIEEVAPVTTSPASVDFQ